MEAWKTSRPKSAPAKRSKHSASVLREKVQKYRTVAGDIHHPERTAGTTAQSVPPNIYSHLASEGGFGRFHSSLHGIIHRMGRQYTLEEKWQKVSDYLDNFFWDQHCATAERMARALYDAAKRKTSHLPQPCEPRMAVSCMLLDQFLYYFGKIRPGLSNLCTEIKEEVFKGIFLNPPSSEPTDFKPFHEHETDPHQLEVISANFMNETWFSWKALHDAELGDADRIKASAMGEAAYWKDLYLRKVFVAWRLHVNQGKQKQYEFAKIKADLQTQTRKTEEVKIQLKEANHKLQEIEFLRNQLKGKEEELMQLQMQNQKLQDLSKLNAVIQKKDEEIKERTERVNELSSKMEKQTQRIHRTQEDFAALQEIMYKWFYELRGPKHEHELRENAADVLQTALTLTRGQLGPNGNDGTPMSPTRAQGNTDIILLDWVNTMTQRFPAGHQYKLHSLSGGPDICNAYLCLLSVLAPDLLSISNCDKALKSSADLTYKAQVIRSVLQQMGITGLVNDVEMTQPGSVNQHRLGLAVLFQRWADGTAVTLSGARPLQQAHQDTTDVEYYTAQEWNLKFTEWTTTTKKWKQISQHILRQCEQRCLEEVRGTPHQHQEDGNVAENTELAKYTTVTSRIKDLLPKDVESKSALLQQLTGVLTSNFNTLRNVYRYYASSDPSVDNVMSVQEFWRFCTDAKIANKTIDRTVVKTIFAEVNKTVEEHIHEAQIRERRHSREVDHREVFRRLSLYSSFHVESDQEDDDGIIKDKDTTNNTGKKSATPPPSGKSSTPPGSSRSTPTPPPAPPIMTGHIIAGGQKVATESAVMKAEMTPEEWIESLIRLAHKSHRKNNESLPTALGHLITSKITKHCLQVDFSDFKRQVYSKEVQDILRGYNQHLSDCFKHYGRTVISGSPYELNMSQWKKILSDADLFDEVFTHYAAQSIFTKLQEDDSIDMMFHEFLEALVAVAAFKNPAPYLPIHQRVEHFLHLVFFPRLCHKFYWSDYKASSHPKKH